ncbi:MAG: hypothetical protein M3463_17850, partial [Verrucomicrobiota bacterium]|nr:hypothetical protein [Verrucomicrobiota bacterium]
MRQSHASRFAPRAIALVAAFGSSLSANAQVPAKVTYNEHVLPIFRNTCLNCHNPDKKKAGLDLSTYQGALQGSENGKVLESGNPGKSLLFKCVKGLEEPMMPPKGDRLSDSELAVIEKWIQMQLLESGNSKGVAAANNNVQLAVVSLERPAGPPPMPGELSLEPVVRTKTANALVALAVSPWAPLVAIGGQKQIFLYHTETLEPLGVLPFPEGFPHIIRFSRNGQLLLTGGGLGGKSGHVVLWDVKTGERIATVGNEVDAVLAADLSPDQQFVALGGPAKLVKIYSTKDGKLLHSIKKHTDWVTAIAYSPDGKFLASADRNGGIQIWEGSTGKDYSPLPGHKVMVTGLAFMTGVLASSSEDGKVALWDVKEGKEIKTWNAHTGGAAWVDFAPDGRLVSCGRDKVAKVWDQTGKQLGATPAFGDIALRAALNSERVIAGDWAGQIRVFSIDGKSIGELTANPPSILERLAAVHKRLAEAHAGMPALQQQLAAAEQALSAEKAAAEEKQRAEEAAAETAQTKPPPSTAQKSSPSSVPAASPAEQAVGRARVAIEQANAQIATANSELQKWKLAQFFQASYRARQSLAARQARYDELLEAAKQAQLPADEVRAGIEAAERQLAEAVAKVGEKGKLLTQLTTVSEPVSKTIGVAESALSQTEAKARAVADGFNQASAEVGQLTKKAAPLQNQLAELVKARNSRLAELGAAQKKLLEQQAACVTGEALVAAEKQVKSLEQARETAMGEVNKKKEEIAGIQTRLAAATARANELKPQIELARADAARAKETLENARVEAKAASDKAAAA